MLSLRVRVSLFSARCTPSMKAAPPSRFSSLSKARRAKQRSQGASNLRARSPRCTLIRRRVLYVRISAPRYIERLYPPRWTRAGHCHLSIADSFTFVCLCVSLRLHPKLEPLAPSGCFQKMLGLMAFASPVLQLGLLRMQHLQYWLKH